MRCFLLVVLGTILVTSAPNMSTVPSGKVAQFPLSKQFPIPIRQGFPPYPTVAIAKKISGAVLVDIRVNSDGTVAEANVLTGPEILRKPAQKAAMDWRFKPLAPDIGPYVLRLTFIWHERSYVAPAKVPDVTSPYQMEVPYPAYAP